MPKAVSPSTISIGYLVDGDTAQPGLQVRFPPELMDLSKECQENFLSQIIASPSFQRTTSVSDSSIGSAAYQLLTLRFHDWVNPLDLW